MCDEKIFSTPAQVRLSKSNLLANKIQYICTHGMEVDRVCKTMKEKERKVASKVEDVEEEEVRLVVPPRVFDEEKEKAKGKKGGEWKVINGKSRKQGAKECPKLGQISQVSLDEAPWPEEDHGYDVPQQQQQPCGPPHIQQQQ